MLNSIELSYSDWLCIKWLADKGLAELENEYANISGERGLEKIANAMIRQIYRYKKISGDYTVRFIEGAS